MDSSPAPVQQDITNFLGQAVVADFNRDGAETLEASLSLHIAGGLDFRLSGSTSAATRVLRSSVPYVPESGDKSRNRQTGHPRASPYVPLLARCSRHSHCRSTKLAPVRPDRLRQKAGVRVGPGSLRQNDPGREACRARTHCQRFASKSASKSGWQ